MLSGRPFKIEFCKSQQMVSTCCACIRCLVFVLFFNFLNQYKFVLERPFVVFGSSIPLYTFIYCRYMFGEIGFDVIQKWLKFHV